jgi:hypothetical protein
VEDDDHPAKGGLGLFAIKLIEKDEYVGSYAGARLQSIAKPFEANCDGASHGMLYGMETRQDS